METHELDSPNSCGDILDNLGARGFRRVNDPRKNMSTMTQPQTTTLEALLREWAEVEPERISEIGENDPPDDGPFGYWVKWRGTIITLMLDDTDLDVYTQAAAQEAIEARGWVWSLTWDGFRLERNHMGMVQYRETSVDFKSTPGEKFYSDWTDHGSAYALLSAYLQALRAQV